MKRALCLAISLCLALAASPKKNKNSDPTAKTPLDLYIEQAHRRAATSPQDDPGSLWAGATPLGDLGADVRARHIDDIVTILVAESASAVSTGTTKTSRASAATSSVTQLAKALPASSKLANLLNSKTNTSLDGEGTTSRQTTLDTTLTARVIDVLPNGYLVIEGSKMIGVNSENQVVTVRGVVRPADLSNANVVQSSSVGQLEVRINGKGVVNDAARRPNILYRIILGLLPF
ncbi:MAG TPA: flagellar basal body L-ring protein FlgH [Bryobacteraceae bacterium]|nr:flagellar basal body L-ring protein FlgH [Bryobacteraceae bacterium]